MNNNNKTPSNEFDYSYVAIPTSFQDGFLAQLDDSFEIIDDYEQQSDDCYQQVCNSIEFAQQVTMDYNEQEVEDFFTDSDNILENPSGNLETDENNIPLSFFSNFQIPENTCKHIQTKNNNELNSFNEIKFPVIQLDKKNVCKKTINKRKSKEKKLLLKEYKRLKAIENKLPKSIFTDLIDLKKTNTKLNKTKKNKKLSTKKIIKNYKNGMIRQ